MLNFWQDVQSIYQANGKRLMLQPPCSEHDIREFCADPQFCALPPDFVDLYRKSNGSGHSIIGVYRSCVSIPIILLSLDSIREEKSMFPWAYHHLDDAVSGKNSVSGIDSGSLEYWIPFAQDVIGGGSCLFFNPSPHHFGQIIYCDPEEFRLVAPSLNEFLLNLLYSLSYHWGDVAEDIRI